MAKDDKVRHLPGADKPPVEQPPPDEQFARKFADAMEAYDQVVLICGKGGYIVDIIPRRDNRHEVRGMLDEAPEVYDLMTSATFVFEPDDR